MRFHPMISPVSNQTQTRPFTRCIAGRIFLLLPCCCQQQSFGARERMQPASDAVESDALFPMSDHADLFEGLWGRLPASRRQSSELGHLMEHIFVSRQSMPLQITSRLRAG